MTPSTVAIVVLALALLGAVAWAIHEARAGSQLRQERARMGEEVRQGNLTVGRVEQELAICRAQLAADQAALGEAKIRLAGIESDRDATLRAFDVARKKMEETFSALARNELDKTARTLRIEAMSAFQQRKVTIEEMLKPVRESLDRYTRIGEQVRKLESFGESLKKETDQVVTALRGSSQVRGAWGEMLLKRLLEVTGLEENVHFRAQVTVSTEAGRPRPDFVVSLPNGGVIVIDSKVAAEAYFQAMSAPDERQRTEAMERHARDVRNHMDSLRKKDYAALFDCTPEFVVMFLPTEAHLAEALRVDAELLEHGIRSRVIPAAPLTMWAILNGVALAWRHDRLARNAKAITDEASVMHERLATLVEHLSDLGTKLRQAAAAYQTLLGSFEERALPQARKLEALGVKSGKEIPELEPMDITVREPKKIEAGRAES